MNVNVAPLLTALPSGWKAIIEKCLPPNPDQQFIRIEINHSCPSNNSILVFRRNRAFRAAGFPGGSDIRPLLHTSHSVVRH